MNNNSKSFVSRCLILFILLISISLASCTESSTTTEMSSTTTTTEFSETTTQDNPCSISMTVEVSNGQEQIETEYVVCTTVTDEYTADGFCMIYDYVENINNLPSIEQTTEMSLIKSASINISTIEVFDSEGTLIDTWDSWENREILETGQYFISLNIYRYSDDCDKTGYSIFVLTVN